MFPLIAVTLPAPDAPGHRDTIIHLAGVPTSAMADALSLAAEHYTRHALGVAPDDDCPRLPHRALLATLGWHVTESGIVAEPLRVTTAALAVSRALSDLAVKVAA